MYYSALLLLTSLMNTFGVQVCVCVCVCIVRSMNNARYTYIVAEYLTFASHDCFVTNG